MRSIYLSSLSFALFSSSCIFIPELGSTDPSVPGRFPGNQGGSLPADIAWQKFFADPRLKKIVEVSLANNRDLRIAALNVEQARAQYRISRSDLFPTINAGVDGTHQRTAGGLISGAEFQAYNATVGISSYELDLFGRVRSMNQSALESYFATDAARAAAQISLVAEVAGQYLTERALLEQIDLSQQTLEGMSSIYDLTKQRYDAGDVSELDLRSVEVQVQTAKANLASYRQQLAQTKNALYFLSGGSLPENLPAGRSLDRTLVSDIKAGVPSDLLLRRPDIREAEYNLRAANADIGAARAAFFPSLTLTGNAGIGSNSLSNLITNANGAWTFAPQVTVPIFTGGRNRANLEVAELRKLSTIASYERSIQTGFREVADGLAARKGLADQITANEGLVTAQQKRSELANLRYREGLDSYFEALNAQLDFYTAQQTLIRLRLEREVNSVNLYKALGGGW